MANVNFKKIIGKLFIRCRYEDIGCEAAVWVADHTFHEEHCTSNLLISMRERCGEMRKTLAQLRIAKGLPAEEPKKEEESEEMKAQKIEIRAMMQSIMLKNKSPTPNSVKELFQTIVDEDLVAFGDGIKAGLSVDAKNDEETPLLIEAVKYGRFRFCDLLLRHGANPNASDAKNQTALFFAAAVQSTMICQMLLDHGASVYLTSDQGQTALMEAAKTKNFDIVKIFLENGSEINKQDDQGWSALHFAIPCPNRLLFLFLKYQVNVNIMDNDGITPLKHAFLFNSSENALVLARAGADFNLSGDSAWNFANKTVKKQMIKNGFKPPPKPKVSSQLDSLEAEEVSFSFMKFKKIKKNINNLEIHQCG